MIISTVESCGHRSRGAVIGFVNISLQERKLKLLSWFLFIYSNASRI